MSRPVADIVAELEVRDLLDLAGEVAGAHHVTVAEMLGTSRVRPVPAARHEFWARLYARGHWSYPRIGTLVGADHTTIMAGVRQAHRRGDVPAEVRSDATRSCA